MSTGETLLAEWDRSQFGIDRVMTCDELKLLDHARQKREDDCTSYAKRQNMARTRRMRYYYWLEPFMGRRESDSSSESDRVKHRRLVYGASITE